MSSQQMALPAYSKGAIKLINTAEKLFGEQGVDRVSLRQIVSAAGMANSYAVQHHFGSKAGLVQAVYDYRIPALEEGARRLLQEAQEKAGEITFRALLTARFLPLVDSLGVKAQRSFSLFLLRLLDRKNDMHPFSLSTVPQPVAHDINRRMESCFPDLPVQVFDSRFRLASDLFIGAIVEKHRLDTVSQDLYLNSQRYWEEVLDIMEAVFAVPYKGLL